MEWTIEKSAVQTVIKKYRWVFLVLIIGMLLMLLPAGNKEIVTEISDKIDSKTESVSFQKELELFLSQLEGAGQVRVLLTESIGQQTIYQTDQNTRKSGETEEVRKDTVILTEADRSGTGLISRVDPPRYLGAVVLCQGADKATVRLAIADAVSTATGLGSDKISIWKMK